MIYCAIFNKSVKQNTGLSPKHKKRQVDRATNGGRDRQTRTANEGRAKTGHRQGDKRVRYQHDGHSCYFSFASHIKGAMLYRAIFNKPVKNKTQAYRQSTKNGRLITRQTGAGGQRANEGTAKKRDTGRGGANGFQYQHDGHIAIFYLLLTSRESCYIVQYSTSQ